MIPTLVKRPMPLPCVARLGFDDGWLLLPPTFLNLRAPVVVLDHAYIGDSSNYGLQPFGACDPKAPLPRTYLMISSYGDLITIRSRSTAEILATTWRQDQAVPMLATYSVAVMIIGSTYELQLTWAALWTMAIGRAEISNHEESNDFGRTTN